MSNRQFQSACLIASMLGLTSVGVFAESSEKEAIENAKKHRSRKWWCLAAFCNQKP